MKKLLEIQGKGLLFFYLVFVIYVVRESSLMEGTLVLLKFITFVTVTGLFFELIDILTKKLENMTQDDKI